MSEVALQDRPPASGPMAAAGQRLLARRATSIALVALLLLVAGAGLAPLLAPRAERGIALEHRNESPSLRHPFGTDDLGRDTLVRVLAGGRVSLSVAGIATLVAVAIGTLLGLLAGYRGGVLDAAVVHGVDLALSVPTFFVLLLLSSWWGASFAALCVVLGVTNWMPVARLVRSATLSLRERTHVEAARALGLGTTRILLRHILPLVLAPILVAAVLTCAQAILLEAALSFLGFGLQPPTPSWGNMLQEAQAHILDAPWAAFFPGLFVLGTVLALHVVADAVRDILDPHLATRG